jgi:hypothetical protein
LSKREEEREVRTLYDILSFPVFSEKIRDKKRKQERKRAGKTLQRETQSKD